MTDAPEAIWQVLPGNPEIEELFVRELSVPPLIARLLVQRGFTSAEEADRFLNPKLEHLNSPRLLPDFEPAVAAILGAKERNEVVYVHGDYDVDGVSSTAIFTRFLRRIGMNIIPHVPHRMEEGYGIHMDAVKWAKEHGTDLFLTCDCGVLAFEQVDAINELGMRAVITDHHSMGDRLPNAVAVVNPHREDSKYPYPDLAGAGVVFQLCAGISEALGVPVERFHRAFLDLAVLGTISDVMPLTGDNRVISKFGLEQLRTTQKIGLQELKRVSGINSNRPMTATDIGFKIGPRINAVGRIDDAAIALDLFLTDDRNEAMQLAETMDRVNQERREQQAQMIDEAVAIVEESGQSNAKCITVAKEGWHPGIVGIVAGKIAEKYYRPAIVIAIDGDEARASARSIPAFHIGNVISKARDTGVAIMGGGHAEAAGMSIHVDRIEEFKALFSEMAESLTQEDLIPQITCNGVLDLEDADVRTAALLHQLEPYGMANPKPLFALHGVGIQETKLTASGEHVQFTAADGPYMVKGIAFGMADSLADKQGCELDLAAELELNEWNGVSSPKLVLKSFRLG
ncbi:MAG: single-stranded-DNA-specific exonuclease RecJ [Fimbriimonadaceae bacterium]